MNKKEKISRRFLASPYLCILVLLYLNLIFFALGIPAFRDYIGEFPKIGDWGAIIKTEDFKAFLVIAIILIANFVVIYIFSEQYFGVLNIKDDRIVLCTPLKRRRVIRYDEIQAIGIDIGTTGAFWIYISRTAIPVKYQKKINKIPLRYCDILFAYSDKAYNSLCMYLPKKLSKRFAASASILRLYNKSE